LIAARTDNDPRPLQTV